MICRRLPDSTGTVGTDEIGHPSRAHYIYLALLVGKDVFTLSFCLSFFVKLPYCQSGIIA